MLVDPSQTMAMPQDPSKMMAPAQMSGMQYFDPNAMAQLQTDQMKLAQRQQLAQSFLSAGYVPNSGRGGVLTAILSGLTGGILQGRNNEKAADVIKRQFELESQAAQARRAQDLADEQRKLQEKITEQSTIDRNKAQSERQYAKPEFQGGGTFDPATGQWTANQGYAQQQIGIKAGEADAAARATAKYREAPGAGEIAGLQAKVGLALKMGASPADIQRMLTGHDSGNQIVPGVGVVDKDTGQVKPMVGPDGKPVAQPLTEAQQTLAGKGAAAKQALGVLDDLQKKLKSGSAWTGPIDQFIPGESQQSFQAGVDQLVNPLQTLTRVPGQGSQSDAELKQLMAGFPSLGSREDVNLEKINRLRQYIGNLQGAQGGSQPAQAPAAPTQTATNAQGQRIGLVNGQWVPI